VEKIICLFQRRFEGRSRIARELTPGAEWVAAGEGVATRKFDGTCCLLRGGRLLKRYQVNKHRTPPPGFEPATELDPVTGKQQGWLPVGDGPDDRWFREALDRQPRGTLADGTYELCGPKLQGNPEGFEFHTLVPHGVEVLPDAPRDYDGLIVWLTPRDIEGIVWHHPDGRMVKIRKRDFELPRKPAM
jgi:hypothetical protein